MISYLCSFLFQTDLHMLTDKSGSKRTWGYCPSNLGYCSSHSENGMVTVGSRDRVCRTKPICQGKFWWKRPRPWPRAARWKCQGVMGDGETGGGLSYLHGLDVEFKQCVTVPGVYELKVQRAKAYSKCLNPSIFLLNLWVYIDVHSTSPQCRRLRDMVNEIPLDHRSKIMNCSHS